MRRFAFAMVTLVFSASAWATPSAVEIEPAADHQVAAQGKFPGGLADSWEFVLGSGESARNLTGVSAQGLLAAHALSGLQEYQDAALRAASSLIRAYDGGWNRRRPHTQDVEFLSAAGRVIDAGRWFAVLAERWKPADFVDHAVSRRGGSQIVEMAGWDVASAMRAAMGVGQMRYAQGLVQHLMLRRAAWDVDLNPQIRLLSYGSLLWSLAVLRDVAGLSDEQQQFANSLLQTLLSARRSGGAFALRADEQWFSTQTAAYAVLGLSHWPAGKRAASRARVWLARVAQDDGRFFAGGRFWASSYSRDGRPAPDYHAEVQSEVMMALAAEAP